MIKIYNNIIPLKGFTAITFWPLLFIRNDELDNYNETVERHEAIHGEQQKEMLIVPFLLWYCIEWMIKLCYYRNTNTAYKNISFEREAYDHQREIDYMDNRKHFAWLKEIKK